MVLLKEIYESIRVGANFEKTQDNIVKLINERNRRGLVKPTVCVFIVAQKNNFYQVEKVKAFWRKIADNVNCTIIDSRGGVLPSPELQWENIKARRLYPCIWPFRNLVVLSDGRVVLCCVDYDGIYALGNLNNQTISEVWNSSEYREIRELHFKGRGDKIKLCREKKCRALYRDSSYAWWSRV